MGVNKKGSGEDSSPLILQLIQANPSIIRKELAASLGVSQSTVYRELGKFVDAGLLKREGSDKNGKWVVK